MNGTLPDWIARVLDLPAAESGAGVVERLDHHWTWAPWITLLFVASCGAFILWAYWTEPSGARRWLRLLLASIRGTLVGLALMMIAQWTLLREKTGLPYLALVIDDSASMARVDRYADEAARYDLARRATGVGLDELSRLNVAKSILLADKAALLDDLAKRFRLKLYFIPHAAREQAPSADPQSASLAAAIQQSDARGAHTRLGQGLQKILEDLRGSPPAAIVILSDGINTDGPSLADAAALAQRRGVPLFTIGVGSEQAPRDIELSDLLVDEVAFVNDILNFDFKLTASGYQGQQLEVVLREKSHEQVLARKSVTVRPDGEVQKVRLPYRPTEAGDFEYVIEVAPQPDEANPDNNRLRRQVAVRMEQLRVLLVNAYPSFEFRYLKHLLQRDTASIDLKTLLQDADVGYADTDKTALRVFPVRREELFQFDVVIFGDVDAARLSAQALSNLADFVREKGGGLLLIAGPLYNPATYRDTPLAPLVPVDLATIRPMPATSDQGYKPIPTDLGLSSPQMQLGDTPAETEQIWRNLPDLFALCQAPRLRPGAQALAEHPTLTGEDGARLPVIALQYAGAGKVIFHATDETYRWRYLVGDVFFSRYWVQTIRYLSRAKLLAKDRSAELTADRREYQRGEPVRFRVRFVDERLAPVEDDGVRVVVEQPGQPNQNIILRRNSASRGVFEGVLAQPAEGSYHAWLAVPTVAGTAPAADFIVAAPPGESARLQMDAAELRAAAELTKGRYYSARDVRTLSDDLPEARPVPIETLSPTPLWNRRPVLILFLVLLACEWVLRKTQGMV